MSVPSAAAGSRSKALSAARPTSAIARVRRVTHAMNQHSRAVRAGSLAITFVVWELYGRGVDPLFFSYPTAILATVPQLILSGELPKALASSSQAFVIGFAIAILSGVLVGLLTGRYRLIDNLLDSQITALYSTPNVALIPLLMLWFGLDLKVKVVIIFLSAFFPIIVNTQGGVRNVSKSLVEIALAEGANELQVFTKIIVPGALPFIMTGIRLAVGRAVVGMVVAEMFTAINGLGGRIVYYSNQFATAKLLVVIIVLALLGVALTEVAKYFENRLAPWKATERASA